MAQAKGGELGSLGHRIRLYISISEDLRLTYCFPRTKHSSFMLVEDHEPTQGV